MRKPNQLSQKHWLQVFSGAAKPFLQEGPAPCKGRGGEKVAVDRRLASTYQPLVTFLKKLTIGIDPFPIHSQWIWRRRWRNSTKYFLNDMEVPKKFSKLTGFFEKLHLQKVSNLRRPPLYCARCRSTPRNWLRQVSVSGAFLACGCLDRQAAHHEGFWKVVITPNRKIPTIN